MLKGFVNNPYVNMASGLLLLGSSGYEIFVAAEELTVIGTGHGIFVYAILHTLRSFPEITHGLDNVEKAHEERAERKEGSNKKAAH